MPSPSAPISVDAEVRGKGQTGLLVVRVITEEQGPSAQIDLTLPDGVRLVSGSIRTEAAFKPGEPRIFRYGLKADKPGAYVLNVKVMAGSEDYRFGKNFSVAWIAQAD